MFVCLFFLREVNSAGLRTRNASKMGNALGA